jgi:hypothetical protein
MAKDGLNASSAFTMLLYLGQVVGPGIWNLKNLGFGSKTLVSAQMYYITIY